LTYLGQVTSKYN